MVLNDDHADGTDAVVIDIGDFHIHKCIVSGKGKIIVFCLVYHMYYRIVPFIG